MRKYRKTTQITSLDELSEQTFIMYRNKVYHRGWFGSWQFRMIHDFMKRGLLWKVENNESNTTIE